MYTCEELEATCEELKATLKATRDLLAVALKRIAKLEERLNKNSKNSSKPPSTDRKPDTQEKKKTRAQRKKGFSRPLFTPDQVDHFITCSLTDCPSCGSSQLQSKGSPLTLQQIDLPEVKAVVTQFTCTKHKCSSCGVTSFGDLPKGVPDTAFGSRLMALLATLTGSFHLSKRDGMQLVQDLYGIKISEGSIINVEERVACALQAVEERIHGKVMTGVLAKHFDETSWRHSGKNHYVWIGSTSEATCYRIDPNRSREAFERFAGILSPGPVVTDRYAAYSHLKGPHQYCLAHLIRDFRKYSERDGPDMKIGKAIKEELQLICRNQREFRRKEISKRARDASTLLSEYLRF